MIRYGEPRGCGCFTRRRRRLVLYTLHVIRYIRLKPNVIYRHVVSISGVQRADECDETTRKCAETIVENRYTSRLPSTSTMRILENGVWYRADIRDGKYRQYDSRRRS